MRKTNKQLLCSSGQTTKLCIVTWQGGANFGTNLQAYALQRCLEEQGYFVHILSSIPDFNNPISVFYHLVSEWRIYRLWLRIKSVLNKSFRLVPDNPGIRRWAREELNIYRILFPRQLYRLLADIDCFITGSDQLWNTFFRIDPTMFLEFAKDKKCISYATSLGAKGVNPKCVEMIKSWLKKYRHIAVRERSSVSILESITGRRDIVTVLDPTFLLSQKDWTSFSLNAAPLFDESKPFILCYLLGTSANYEKQVEDIRAKAGIARIILVPSAENPSFSIKGAKVLRNLSPPEFVRLLSAANLVCTDSFHATALSINLSKTFVVFMRFSDSDPASQNCRLTELLEHFGLESRVYKEGTNEWSTRPDYSKSQGILERDRLSAMQYLQTAIAN